MIQIPYQNYNIVKSVKGNFIKLKQPSQKMIDFYGATSKYASFYL